MDISVSESNTITKLMLPEDSIAVYVYPHSGYIADYIPFADYAKEWKVAMVTMHAWRRRGKLPGAIKIGREWYLPVDSTKPEPKKRGVKGKYEDS